MSEKSKDEDVIVQLASALEGLAREEYLATACGENPELGERVRLRLAAAESTEFPASIEGGSSGGVDGESGTTPVKDGAGIESGGRRDGEFVPGQVIAGRYRIVSKLGRGGMGEVYRADDLKLGQPVALKFLPPTLASDRRLLDALYNEVRLARRVTDRHVTRVFDIGETDGLHFLSMEYIEGENLSSLLRRIGRLPEGKAVELAKQLCNGLCAAHEEGLLHLDLKPANLMIDERGQLKITDFGLARLLGDAEAEKRRAGTPAYMAPEQLLRGENSKLSDIYSSGLIFYEMITGKCVQAGRSFKEIVSWHESSKNPEPPSNHVPSLPGDIESLIMRCVDRDPSGRPGSISEVRAGLESAGFNSQNSSASTGHGEAEPGKHLAALMFTDIVGSVALQEKLGTADYTRAVDQHDRIFRKCLDEVGGGMILNETGDGFLVSLQTPTDAVRAALLFQHHLRKAREEEGCPVSVRVGLHLGVVTEVRESVRGEKRAVGMPINIAARIMDLAESSQILITRTIYDDARHHVKRHPETGDEVGGKELQWIAHGRYAFKGSEEPIGVFEVGVDGTAPLTAPGASNKAWPVDQKPSQPGAGGDHSLLVPVEVVEPAKPEELKFTDVFISYAPVDDKPLVAGKRGWISQFHENLEVRLEQLSGEPVKIWRDIGQAVANPSDEILENLPAAKTMVSILSPPFLKSPGCLREIDEFWKSAERSGNLRVSDKTRILKAIKTPLPPGASSPEVESRLAQLAGFEFFETDPETGRMWEYDDTFGEKAKQRYFERIYDLAYEIRDVLQAIGRGAPEKQAVPEGGRIVYLAEVTSDLASERDKLKRELLERGHRVVPELPLPVTGPEFESQVRLLLEESDFAVHLVGARYGMVPEDTEGSVVELQNSLAAERCRTGKLERLIWMPRDVIPRDDRQGAFLELLVEDPNAHYGGEVVQDSMEDFKRMLLDKLAPEREDKSTALPVPSAEGGPPTIYLIYEQSDEEAVEPLEDALFDLGFEVTTPHFEGNEVEAGKVHRHNLLHCDAALVYYGSASKPWVEMKLMDLMRAPGYGRTKDLVAKSVYIPPSADRRKARFRTHLADVIRTEGTPVDLSALGPFTNQLRKGGGAP